MMDSPFRVRLSNRTLELRLIDVRSKLGVEGYRPGYIHNTETMFGWYSSNSQSIPQSTVTSDEHRIWLGHCSCGYDKLIVIVVAPFDNRHLIEENAALGVIHQVSEALKHSNGKWTIAGPAPPIRQVPDPYRVSKYPPPFLLHKGHDSGRIEVFTCSRAGRLQGPLKDVFVKNPGRHSCARARSGVRPVSRFPRRSPLDPPSSAPSGRRLSDQPRRARHPSSRRTHPVA